MGMGEIYKTESSLNSVKYLLEHMFP